VCATPPPRPRLGAVAKLGHNGVVDIFYLGANDDLELTTGADYFQHAVEITNGDIIGKIIIMQVEPNTGDAVGDASDVVFATDLVDDVPG